MRTAADTLLGCFLNVVEAASDLPRSAKRFIVFALDGVLLVAATWIAYSLRVGSWMLSGRPVEMVMLVGILAMIPIFTLSGVYKAIFRYAGVGMMRNLLVAFFFYTLVMSAIFLFWGFVGIPRTLGLIQPVIFFLLVAASRITMRTLIVDVLGRRRFGGERRIVVIYGAGSQGQQVAASMRNDPELHLLAYVDDDERLWAQRLDGLKVFSPQQLDNLIATYRVSHILLALPNAGRQRRNEILDRLSHHHVDVLTLPPMKEIVGGKVSVNDVRPLDIGDLLGRESVQPIESLVNSTIVGKSVMVTGAGGSIGSELCREICRVGARRLVLLEQSEFALYAIHRELTEYPTNAGREIVPVLGSVVDGEHMARVMLQHDVETVYHAAAYKHVPLVEANPLMAVRNNVVGTYEAARAARNSGVGDFILVSTDKAVRPTNVMGATKRAAEQILQSFAHDSRTTRFSMVRFGNVLGSSGSVVPLFRQQIEAGGPVTVTHRDVTRYFMTIPEAANLVIQAGGLAKGGEVFVLDMGSQVKIIDLARSMITLSGMTLRDESNPRGDIEIVEIGLRPGEKLYEELLIEADAQPTIHPQIMKAHEEFMPWSELSSLLGELAAARDASTAIALLGKLVPEFQHRRDDICAVEPCEQDASQLSATASRPNAIENSVDSAALS